MRLSLLLLALWAVDPASLTGAHFDRAIDPKQAMVGDSWDQHW